MGPAELGCTAINQIIFVEKMCPETLDTD